MDLSKCSVRYDFVGVLVMEPTPGTVDNVVVADYKSMYPTIMLNCYMQEHANGIWVL